MAWQGGWNYCPEPYIRAYGVDQLALELYSCEMDDDTVKRVFTPELRQKLHSELKKAQPDADAYHIHVDLSNNSIGPAGIKAMVDFMLSTHETGKPICVRILKLFKNRLGDEGMWHLARLALLQPLPIHEVHLTHNGITSRGAASLLLAFGLHPGNAYPIRVQSKREGDLYAGCWCRLERNNVQNAGKLVTALDQIGGVRVLETRRADKEWGPLRSPSWVKKSQEIPHAVLHMFGDQSGKSPNQAEEPLETMVAQMREDVCSLLASEQQTVSQMGQQVQSLPFARPRNWSMSTADSRPSKWAAQPTYYPKWVPKAQEPTLREPPEILSATPVNEC